MPSIKFSNTITEHNAEVQALKMTQSFLPLASVEVVTESGRPFKTAPLVETLNRSSLARLYKLDVVHEMLDRLDSLKALEDNWDDEGAVRIEEASYANVKNLVLEVNSHLLNKWIIFPSSNGTLLLSRREQKMVTLNVGNHRFTYVMSVDGHVLEKGHGDFNIDEVTKLVLNLSK